MGAGNIPPGPTPLSTDRAQKRGLGDSPHKELCIVMYTVVWKQRV